MRRVLLAAMTLALGATFLTDAPALAKAPAPGKAGTDSGSRPAGLTGKKGAGGGGDKVATTTFVDLCAASNGTMNGDHQCDYVNYSDYAAAELLDWATACLDLSPLYNYVGTYYNALIIRCETV